MNARDARRTFLEFFRKNGHEILPSSPVIPHGDRTLLFTNAGMNQFKDIFTGKVTAKFPRAATVQKCIRAGGKHNDLDNVGYTSRHLTFFEMLGNFSFGDYFKREAISLAWKLVTEGYGIDPGRLWVTVFHEDDDARELWRTTTDLPSERIVGLGEKDNYWSMGDVGPCGPCSEILLDRGDAFGEADLENGERFFEIWNLVFMQFDQKPSGEKVPLPRPSIDTGMGLERLLMVLQDVPTVFETDILGGIIRRVEEITGHPYDRGGGGVAHRVIADHVRSLVFAFADGAEPSNEGRGYVLRRILRRAARYARKIHDDGPFLHRLVGDVVEEMGEAFPEIVERREFIERLILSEEDRFGETLDTGLQLFEEVVAQMKRRGLHTVPGRDVFKLYDTFGFPVDLVEQMAQETGLDVDQEGFEKLMQAQKERSRVASQFQVDQSASDALNLERLPETRFCGYERASSESEIQSAAKGRVDESEGDLFYVVLDATPFYAESGGQVGDSGWLRGDDFELEVTDTQKDAGRFVHTCRLCSGDRERIRSGTGVVAKIDATRRARIERNHTATHLLHAALREVLGTHVHQRGSLVEASRLRFDVTHFQSISPEEIERVSKIVRDQVLADTPIETFETDYEDAVSRGAMALFGEKYGDRVRVVQIGDFSMELCGGTHVGRTGQIGPFLVSSEGSVSSGVRRLEALSGEGAAAFYGARERIVEELGSLLKARPEGLVERVRRLIEENRELRSRAPSATASLDQGALERTELNGALFVSALLDGVDGKALREVYDGVRKESEEVVASIFSRHGEKLQIVVGVSTPLVKKGVDAREIFRAGASEVGGRGGGRPELVQGGGSGAAEAVKRATALMLEAARRALKGA